MWDRFLLRHDLLKEAYSICKLVKFYRDFLGETSPFRSSVLETLVVFPKPHHFTLENAFIVCIGTLVFHKVEQELGPEIKKHLSRSTVLSPALNSLDDTERTHFVLFLGFLVFLIQGYAGTEWELGLVQRDRQP